MQRLTIIFITCALTADEDVPLLKLKKVIVIVKQVFVLCQIWLDTWT
jgi:hypothetical protein